MACTQCPLDRPFYDSLTNQCVVQINQPIPIQCPTGFSYDSLTKQCKPTSNGGITIAQCPPSTPLWDVIRGTCVACDPGYQFNPTTKSCVACPDAKNCGITIVQNQTCPTNYQWDASSNRCVRCELWQKWNSVTKLCDNFCRPGEVYDFNL